MSQIIQNGFVTTVGLDEEMVRAYIRNTVYGLFEEHQIDPKNFADGCWMEGEYLLSNNGLNVLVNKIQNTDECRFHTFRRLFGLLPVAVTDCLFCF